MGVYVYMVEFGFERGKTLKTDKENGRIISYSELVTSAISQPLRAANINCHRALDRAGIPQIVHQLITRSQHRILRVMKL